MLETGKKIHIRLGETHPPRPSRPNFSSLKWSLTSGARTISQSQCSPHSEHIWLQHVLTFKTNSIKDFLILKFYILLLSLNQWFSILRSCWGGTRGCPNYPGPFRSHRPSDPAAYSCMCPTPPHALWEPPRRLRPVLLLGCMTSSGVLDKKQTATVLIVWNLSL